MDNLPVGWASYSIDELKAKRPSSIAIGPFGSRMKADVYTEAGIPVIRGNNISDTTTFNSDFVYVSEQTANSLASANVYRGDLVFPHRGAIGTVGIVKDDTRYVLSTSLMKMTCNPDLADPAFLFYYFRSPIGKHELLKNTSTVGTPGIATPLTSLKAIRLALPPLPEQRAIAHILGTLDDKIDLNRRMNQTLEALARALFRSWFVDFDPVRAKAAGRRPEGMADETAALFPAQFEESEPSVVPKGWTHKPLDRIAHFLNGLALQKFPPTDEAWLPVIKIAQLRKGSAEGADRASAAIPATYVVDDGDVLFSWSGSLEVVLWCGGRGALNQHLFKVTSQDYPKWFYYLWVQHHLPEFQAIAASKATTMGHIQRHHLSDALVTVPDEAILHAADRILEPIVGRIIANGLESRTLAALRDILLPRLLSGELRVPDVSLAGGVP